MLTREIAETNEIYHPLMNFFIAPDRNIINWNVIQGQFPSSFGRVRLYRGLAFDRSEYSIWQENLRCTSWSLDKNVAGHFAESKYGVIISHIFTDNDIVFDTANLADDMFKLHKWQKEIVIKPGIYDVDINQI